MADVNKFMHLPFPVKKTGKAKYPQNTVPDEQKTAQTKNNRQAHRDGLHSQAQKLSRFWQNRKDVRSKQNLPIIEGGTPFLLEIEPTTDVEFLRGLGFEVVCNLAEGFIVVSSEQTDLTDFLQKVDGFVSKTRGTGNVAKVYALHSDDDRLKLILSKDLYDQWSVLDNNTNYVVELSVSCAGTSSPPNLPKKRLDEPDDGYNKRVKEKIDKYHQEIDSIIMERQIQLENIVNDYEGEFLTSFMRV